MKMSDVFIIPVDSVARVIRNDQINEYYNDGVTPWDFIDKAINNHDGLESENARLRKALSELIETSDSNECQLSQSLLEFHQESTALSNAKKLLSELEKSNE